MKVSEKEAALSSIHIVDLILSKLSLIRLHTQHTDRHHTSQYKSATTKVKL